MYSYNFENDEKIGKQDRKINGFVLTNINVMS